MVKENTLQDLITLRDALIGCPLESSQDIKFLSYLDKVITYLEDHSDATHGVLHRDR